MRSNQKIINVCLLIIFSTLFACNQETMNETRDLDDSFKEYWFDGKAEVTSYALRQARYGEIWEGDAVIIFVTEPFSAEKQVKLDNPEDGGINVLKMNFVRKFTTGIYPYSTMMSTFSPLTSYGTSSLLKETFSAQEWCGQVFTQMNQRDGAFEINSYSYFEKEGDQHEIFPVTFTENEIWSRIRFNPKELPLGEVMVLPDLMASRLQHFDLSPSAASAELLEQDSISTYTLRYESGRNLRITYETAFPHKIIGWTESVGDLETTAQRKKELKVPYWQLNQKEDLIWRDSLDLN